jgi:hypothetical protein
MDHDAGGLVNDEEVLVCVRDRQVRRRSDRFGGRLRGSLDLDLLTAGEPVALTSDFPVDEDRTPGEQTLGRSARAYLRQAGEPAVEAAAGGLRGNAELLYFDGRGSRSARRSAESRITTPITMKLSARLNAGQ